MRQRTRRGTRRATALAGAAALALGAAGAARAATYTVAIDNLAVELAPEEAPGAVSGALSGGGAVTIDSAAGGPSGIDALSLSVRTLAQVGDTPTVLSFRYGLGDVVFASGLGGPLAPDLSGVTIGLGDKASRGGEAVLLDTGSGALILDFTAGVASAFCVGLEPGVQCVRDGGSSSGVEVGLSAAVVPLPAAWPLLAAALGGLGLLRRRA